MPPTPSPSLIDELLPLPVPSAHGPTDSLAAALRRSAALAVIVIFLLATVFLLVYPAHDAHTRSLAHAIVARGVVLAADR